MSSTLCFGASLYSISDICSTITECCDLHKSQRQIYSDARHCEENVMEISEFFLQLHNMQCLRQFYLYIGISLLCILLALSYRECCSATQETSYHSNVATILPYFIVISCAWTAESFYLC
jgi:hypothetical protein